MASVRGQMTLRRSYFRIRKALENKANMEEDKIAILESQLAEAKQIAEEADKKYDEVYTPHRFSHNYTHFKLLNKHSKQPWPSLIPSVVFVPTWNLCRGPSCCIIAYFSSNTVMVVVVAVFA